MGFAGNTEPQFIMPSCIAVKDAPSDQTRRRVARGVEDLDFFIGDEATAATNYTVKVNFVQPIYLKNELSIYPVLIPFNTLRRITIVYATLNRRDRI